MVLVTDSGLFRQIRIASVWSCFFLLSFFFVVAICETIINATCCSFFFVSCLAKMFEKKLYTDSRALKAFAGEDQLRSLSPVRREWDENERRRDGWWGASKMWWKKMTNWHWPKEVFGFYALVKEVLVKVLYFVDKICTEQERRNTRSSNFKMGKKVDQITYASKLSPYFTAPSALYVCPPLYLRVFIGEIVMIYENDGVTRRRLRLL